MENVHNLASDAQVQKHIGYVGLLTVAIALGIGFLANYIG